MSSHSFMPLGRSLSLILLLACVSCLSVQVAMAQAPAVDAVIDPSAAETCVAVFTVMAYAYADDDLKERQLEEKKLLARADIPPQQETVFAGADPSPVPTVDGQAPESLPSPPQSSQDRIEHTMDALTEMMLNAPAQAQGIARQCFRQYPPEIELN